MNTRATAHPFWSTASFGDPAHTSPMELEALGAHLDLCKASRGRLFVARSIAETLNRYVAPRFVTTLLAVVALLIGVGALML